MLAAAGVDGIATRCMATDQDVALETIGEIDQLTGNVTVRTVLDRTGP